MFLQRFSFGTFFLVLINLSAVIYGFDCKSKEEKLQVHLVPHTHDDVGWLKTVDEYFYGANNSIQNAGVQYILDTVVAELQKDPDRTFIYVEIAFFERWWHQQDESTKDIVRKLVKNKQLEFINGGWCMNDEASTHYNAIIDQMTIGLRFIDENFGSDARPTVAWHIDPFGHSAEQASLFSLMSFNGFFFGRIDEEDKQKRIKEQRMEMIWRGSRNYKKLSQIFTGVLYNGYGPPAGFCYDDFCADPPIQDDPKLFDVNVQERVNAFVAETCEQAQHYKTKNIILTMGSDFQYANALRWYKNLDKLIKYVNKDGRINVFYSSPSRYLEAVHNASKEWEVKRDDFFPYAHCDHCYWTGYFTSRPTLKGYVRETNTLLQSCKQMEAARGVIPSSPTTETLKRAMGVSQHHDAVSGTEKQHVANDYAKRLYIGREECQNLMGSFISKKFQPAQTAPLKFAYCDYLNVSSCPLTEVESSFTVNVYNPIAKSISSYLRIPVNSTSYTVYEPKGNPVESQVVDVSSRTKNIRKQGALYELVFKAFAPPLGYSNYLIKKTTGNVKLDGSSTYSKAERLTNNNNVINNNFLSLNISIETGRLDGIVQKVEKISLNVDQQFFWYNGSRGNDVSRQTSGAYIFRPNKTKPYLMCKDNKPEVSILHGPVVQEVWQTFGSIVSQVIRLYKDEAYVEFEHTVGPIPIDDCLGKEIITRFDTSLKTDGRFYTDANGREIKERIRNHRDTWVLDVTEPVSGNYYPVNSRIFINDSTSQLTMMSDRSQGGSSIEDGQLEIMLHRRLLVDDFLGVGEPLNETGIFGDGLVTRGKHRLLLNKPSTAAKFHRDQGEVMMMQPILSFAKTPLTVDEWKSQFQLSYSNLVGSIPDNVRLLTMEMLKEDEILLRFENFFEAYELDKTSEVNLKGLFKDFTVVSITEMNLSANQLLKDKKMWEWNTNEAHFHQTRLDRQQPHDLVIELKPMEIRTFVAKIESRKRSEKMAFNEIRDKTSNIIL